MLEVLTGSGLAAAAGLNAYVPLLVLGVLMRFTDLVEAPGTWAWLGTDVALVVLAVLLAVEAVADKVPALDSVNDVLQTAVRPASGGLAFGAGTASTTVRVEDPSVFLQQQTWAPLLAGVVIALVVHLLKALVRPLLNTVSLGLAAPLVSAGEDAGSVVLSLLAVLAPLLAGLAIVALVLVLVRGRRRLRRRRVSQVTGPPRPAKPETDVR